MSKDVNKPAKPRGSEGTSVVEWFTAVAGGILFLVMIGYMAYIGFNEANGEPVIELSSSPPVRQGKLHLVKFEARNVGARTASALVIKARLKSGDNEIETKETTIDYLPSGSVRTGGFYFEHDPSGFEVALEPTNYLDP